MGFEVHENVVADSGLYLAAHERRTAPPADEDAFFDNPLRLPHR